MKKLILISAILITVSIAQAGRIINAPEKLNRTDVSTWLSKSIVYPEKAIDNGVEGSVFVGYKVDTNGKIVVQEIHSTNPALEQSVTEQLAKAIVNTPTKVDLNKTYVIRLRFELK